MGVSKTDQLLYEERRCSIWRNAVDLFSIAEQFLRHTRQEMACSFTVTDSMNVQIFYFTRVYDRCRTFSRKWFHAVSMKTKSIKLSLLTFKIQEALFTMDNVAKTSQGKFFNC